MSFLELKQLATLYRRPLSYFSDEDTDAPDETSQALYRTTAQLNNDDREQVLRFAQFLRDAGPAQPPKRTSGSTS